MESVDSLKKKIEALPRRALAHLPTPLERLENLSHRLGTVDVFLKRDDQTGLAFGGNKARKLEFIMADALRQEANCIITWAGVQSNWCRQTAAAANKLGMKAVLILLKKPGLPYEHDGNLLLDTILDADVRIVDAREGQPMMEYRGVKEIVEPIVEEERQKGLRPYVAPIGGSLMEGSMHEPLGAIAYVKAFVEIYEQAQSQNAPVDAVVFATGSGSTQAGLLVGAKLISPHTRVVGISVSETKATMTDYVRTIAERSLGQLGAPPEVGEEEILVFEDYLGEGYGLLTPEVTDAIRLLAQTEGVLLDPVYTGKAMAGFVDLLKKNYFKKGETVVFLHSGGTPALFPYRQGILSQLSQSS
jgi:D-cysteine desulfhydrase family pyridoxal phosphate-dependent enzyme